VTVVASFTDADRAYDRGADLAERAAAARTRADAAEVALPALPWPLRLLLARCARRHRREESELRSTSYDLLSAAVNFYRANVPARHFRETGGDLIDALGRALVAAKERQ
jgi:hypothetical protein